MRERLQFDWIRVKKRKTPDVRFELTTNGLTVHCSTAELIRNGKHQNGTVFLGFWPRGEYLFKGVGPPLKLYEGGL